MTSCEKLLEGEILMGKLVRSRNRWMIVYPDSRVLKSLFMKMAKLVFAENGKNAEDDKRLVEPLSWNAFPILRENGGLHTTLNANPDNSILDQDVIVEIGKMKIWQEPGYQSSLSKDKNQITYGFVVLLVKILNNDDLNLVCDEPCHISIAQIVNNVQQSNE